ncbi:MAG TPA: ROK family protein [Acidimicrobiia bacterium]
MTPSGPGRPSPMVHTRPEGAVVLAIEISVDYLGVATVGLGGHVYQQVREPKPRGRFAPRETIDDLARMTGPILAALPADASLAGVGVAVAAVIRRSDGFVHLAPNLGWRNVPLGAILAAELGLTDPVLVANEADLGALAEFRRGVGAGVSHLVYVTGEVGIGAGIIHDGKPMLGAAGYAGEAGHTLINPGGLPCSCGATGCWETEAGEAALARHAGIPSTIAGSGLVETVLDRANAGDEIALGAIAEIGRWLGLGIGNLINVFNPELVVLGGFYHPLYPFLEEAVHRGARFGALDAPGDIVEITRSALGSDALLTGAAELALSEVIADPARRGARPLGTRPVEGESGA